MTLRQIITFLFFFSSSEDICAQTLDNGSKKDWYYVDSTGKIVIIGFDYNEGFHNNLASVRKDGKWGFVDTTGKLVIPFEYDLTNGFRDNLALVKKNGLWGYIDTSGRIIIEPQFTQANDFYFNLAAVEKEDKYGYIDRTGNLIIPPVYQFADNLSSTLTRVRKDDLWGYIDTTGKVIVPIKYNWAYELNEGVGRVSILKRCKRETKSYFLLKFKCIEKYGFVDSLGQVIMTKYNYAETFKDGYSRVFKTPWWKLRWNYNIDWKKVDRDLIENDIPE
jgi:hypothetical protein